MHRDVKPENVLLAGADALVADFGIGKALCDVCDDDNITVAGTPIGTPAYMSPEQALGDPVDPRSDIYSLACVLYEMLTGEPPFKGKTVQATLVRHAVGVIPSARALNPRLPAHLDDALQKAMAKSPDDRYRSATEFVGALGLGSAGPVGAAPEQDSDRCQHCGCPVPAGAELCAHCRLDC